MKTLKEYIIDSQLYVSLMGTLLATFFMIEQGSFRFPTFFLLFITYFSGYLYTEFQSSPNIRKILVFNFVTGIVCVILIIQNHNIERLYKLAIICFLGLLYNSSFLKINIRKIPFLKVFYVGLVWGLMNAWLSFETFNFPIFWITFLFVTALTLPFDIHDMDSDRGHVVTFPQVIGVNKTKIIAYILTTLSLVLAVFYMEQIYLIAFSVTYAITIVLTYFSTPTNKDYYYTFFVESCSGLPLLVLGIIQYFN